MDQFKFKPSKIKYQTNITSLDSSHTKFTDNIDKKKDLIDKKKNKLLLLENKLINYDINNIKNENYIEERTLILEEIDNIKSFLNEIEYEELNYYSKTLNILLDYYNLNKVYNDNNQETISDVNIKVNNEDHKKIDKLTLLNEITRNGKKEKKNVKKKYNSVSNNIFNYINDKEDKKDIVVNKSTLYDDYKHIVENISKKIDNDKCISCGSYKIIYRNEGIQSCVNCGESDNFKPEVDITNYKDSMIKKPILPYEKKNHFAVLIIIVLTARNNKYLKVFISNL